jgi:hypothetical protein
VIRVECSACGAAFQARDEHAGKRGRCPKCQAVVTVPAATPAPAPAPPAEPREPPVAAQRTSRAGGGAHRARAGAGSAHQASSFRKHGRQQPAGQPAWLLPALGAVVAVGAIAFFVVQSSGGPDPVKLIQDADSAVNRGDFDAAIAAYTAVPQDSRLHAKAQEGLKEAIEQRDTLAAGERLREAEILYLLVRSIRKDWVEKYGNTNPRYAAHTRYLLERSAEFVERFPDDPRAEELRGYPQYYRNVASLDRPPTSMDVSVAIEWRAQADEFNEAKAAIDAYAAQPGVPPEEVEKQRADLKLYADAAWKVVKARMERMGSLEAGNENWKHVRSQTATYLSKVSALADVGAEARELNAQAEAALSAAGG